jgi:phage/plasmid-associated DNA primase
MPYRYMPDEHAPSVFLGFLDQCWGGDPDYLDKVQALREAMAATMFGVGWQYARAICLYGLPHSGKSVIMGLMRGMVPDNACSNVSPHDWGDKFLSTMMVGQLVNFCGEISETQTIEGDRFKMVVEGAEMMGQFKGRDIFKFKPVCAQWFATNHLPRTRDTSAGFTRRWLFLTFNKPCSLDQKVNRYEDIILSEEREAIAAWAIPAIVDLMRRQDYTNPLSHFEALDEVSMLNNSVRHFIKQGPILFKEDAWITEQDMYRHYLMFTRMVSHTQSMALPRFSTVMKALAGEFGFRVQGSGEGLVYYGIAPAPPKKKAA